MTAMRAGEFGLGFAADDADDRRAQVACPLRCDGADATRRRMDDRDRALAHAIGPAQQYLRRHAFQKRGRGEPVADAVRYRHEPIGIDDACVRISARNRGGVGNAVSDFNLRTPRPTAATVPAASWPRPVGSGLAYRPVRSYTSMKLSPTAVWRTSASPGPGAGAATIVMAQHFGSTKLVDKDRVWHRVAR